MNTPTITPVAVTPEEVASWSESKPDSSGLLMAKSLVRVLPRGKGWIARLLGRTWLRNMQATIATEHGARLVIVPFNLDIYTTSALALDNGVRWGVLDACLEVLKPGHVFYDVGANAGTLSIDLAYTLKDKNVRVISFEPQTWLARALAISAKLNKLDLIEVYPVLLGDEIGEKTLYIPAHSIHASLVPRTSHTRTIHCMQFTIDYLVETGQIPPPDVMKIDVEGAELAVITGAEQTIRQYTPIIVFEADTNMQRFHYTLADITKKLQHYNIVTVHGRHNITTMKAEELQYYGDYIAFPVANGK